MKRTITGALICAMLLCLVSCTATSGVDSSGSVQNSGSSSQISGTPLPLPEYMWSAGETTEIPFESVWKEGYVCEKGDNEGLLQVKPKDSIRVNGEYELPPVTNETPLSEMLSTTGAEYLAVRIATGYYTFPVWSGHPAAWQLFGSERIYTALPLNFLRQTGEGQYYTVCRIDGGGYAYCFFDRPRYDKGSDENAGQYMTEDMTDVYLYSVIYCERVYSKADYDLLKIGDSIDDVIAVDHSALLTKTQWKRSEDAYIKHYKELGVEYMYAEHPYGVTIHLLDDGILVFEYQYNDPDFVSPYDVPDGGEYTYEYDYSHYYIKDIKYFPDYQMKLNVMFGQSRQYDFTVNCNVFPQDYPPAQ